MVVKINKKPIKVTDESEETKEYSWFYWCVSGVGYFMVLYLLDYVSYVFFYSHPLPFVAWLGRWILQII